jgi:8-oxo-dGTP pyrophosphatase MutT (NUDIX family)
MFDALDHRSLPLDETVLRVADVQLRLGPGRWAYDAAARAVIEADWGRRLAANPALYNGRFYILTEWRVSDGALDGLARQADYAAFLHWREAGFPPPRAWNAFSMPALWSADGALLLGRMAAWTANAGRWYPPSGSLEEADLTPDGRFDLEGNMRRELREEIGFEAGAQRFEPGWTLVFSGGRLAMFRAMRLAEPAAALLPRFEAHLATEERSELDGLRFVRSARELDGLDAPAFLHAYLRAAAG